jgi:hypothetical protein
MVASFDDKPTTYPVLPKEDVQLLQKNKLTYFNK